MATKSMKLGGGGKFAAGEKKMEAKGMPKREAGAIMAKEGREKYGQKAMTAMSEHGTNFRDALKGKSTTEQRLALAEELRGEKWA